MLLQFLPKSSQNRDSYIAFLLKDSWEQNRRHLHKNLNIWAKIAKDLFTDIMILLIVSNSNTLQRLCSFECVPAVFLSVDKNLKPPFIKLLGLHNTQL